MLEYGRRATFVSDPEKKIVVTDTWGRVGEIEVSQNLNLQDGSPKKLLDGMVGQKGLVASEVPGSSPIAFMIRRRV